MSIDKRSVFTDATATLGQIIDETAERDAVHIAVEPVVAGTRLGPAQNVRIVDGVAHYATGTGDGVGIVDPFLHELVNPGERFWLFVYPRTITSLRHVWAHPDFGASAEPNMSKALSEKWLRDFVDRSGCPSYEELIALALNGRDSGYGDFEYLLVQGSDTHGDIPAEFWDHVEIVTGQTIPRDERATYFSCSC